MSKTVIAIFSALCNIDFPYDVLAIAKLFLLLSKQHNTWKWTIDITKLVTRLDKIVWMSLLYDTPTVNFQMSHYWLNPISHGWGYFLSSETDSTLDSEIDGKGS